MGLMEAKAEVAVSVIMLLAGILLALVMLVERCDREHEYRLIERAAANQAMTLER